MKNRKIKNVKKRVSYKKFKPLSNAIKALNRYDRELDFYWNYRNTTEEEQKKFDELFRIIDDERWKLVKRGINYNIATWYEPDDPMGCPAEYI